MELFYLTALQIKRTIWVVAAIFLSSCNFILTRYFELDDVQFESKMVQLSYFDEWGIDTTNMINLDSNGFRKLSNNSNYKVDNIGFDGMSVPQFRIYNEKGEIIAGWALCFGKLKKSGILAEKMPNLHWALNRTLNLEKEEEIINKSLKKKDPKTYIVAYWGGYLGKFSERMLISLNEYKDSFYNDNEVEFIKVNIGQNGRYNRN